MRKKFNSIDPFVREYEIDVDGHKISKDDIIKIKGVYGSEFKFVCLVTNPETNVQWIDCIELERNLSRGMRSFRPDRIKPIIKRKKRVKRTRPSKAS
jgi:hypothetical protein